MGRRGRERVRGDGAGSELGAGALVSSPPAALPRAFRGPRRAAPRAVSGVTAVSGGRSRWGRAHLTLGLAMGHALAGECGRMRYSPPPAGASRELTRAGSVTCVLLFSMRIAGPRFGVLLLPGSRKKTHGAQRSPIQPSTTQDSRSGFSRDQCDPAGPSGAVASPQPSGR